ncbi:MAG TPA: trigger factor [Candidatus Saccharimonadales bacterium]|nr:trigger factor [Candidatus Saccharimonadales bacterium]
MKVTRTDKTPTQVTLVVEADNAALEPIKRHVLAHFRHSVKIPGFRAGTAPMALVEKNIDQQQLLDEFMEHALNQLYGKAIQQENLRPIGQPNVQLKKFVPFTNLQFDVETEVIGPVTLPDYKKIKLDKKPPVVDAHAVNEVVKSLQQRMADKKEVQRPAKNGDELVIDFSGTDKDGKPVSGTDAKDYPLTLGKGSFIPGFEENLIGLKAGENKKFTVKFPSDYGVAALQNKDVTFAVDLKKVNELSISKADDAFAAKVGPFKTLAELKVDIKKQLKLEQQQQADRDFENRLIGEIAAQSSVEIPDSMVEEEITRMEDEEKRNLTYRGQTWQEHLAEEGINEEQHRERQRPQAQERIKAGLVLSEIAEKENITVTPEEIETRIQLLKGQYQDQAMQAELDKPNSRRDIESRLMTEKTIEKLVSYSSKQQS